MDAHARALTREELADLPVNYFEAVDSMDVDRVLSYFAEDASFTAQTSQVTCVSADEIRRMFAGAFMSEKTVEHELTNVVVDEVAQTVATEQTFIGELADGTKIEMHNCNFFAVGPEGTFTRVVNWTGENQAAAS